MSRVEWNIVRQVVEPAPWRVESIGNDGEVAIAVFSGPNAQQRAAEYAAWKSGEEIAFRLNQQELAALQAVREETGLKLLSDEDTAKHIVLAHLKMLKKLK